MKIGRLELWGEKTAWNKPSEWYFGFWRSGEEREIRTPCNCYIFELGFFGLTWLSKECAGKV